MPEPENKPAPPQKADAIPTRTDASLEPKKLTPEEQMALYEKELKENDWGHQPC
jgi:hypothetical protein